MKKIAILALAATLTSCASTPPVGISQAQADFDLACKYANGAISAAEPALPLIKGLLLAKFGQDAGVAFDSLISTITVTCSTPLDISKASDVTQRVYDAGGQIVALVVKSQSSP